MPAKTGRFEADNVRAGARALATNAEHNMRDRLSYGYGSMYKYGSTLVATATVLARWLNTKYEATVTNFSYFF